MTLSTGCIVMVTAPSGAGKSSLIGALFQRDPALKLSVSYTTRAPRPGEVHEREYHFVSVEEFNQRKEQGEFLESALVHGNYYATSRVWIMEQIKAGHDIMLEIDWQGALQIKRSLPEAIGVFVLAPSMQTLLERLNKRSQDSVDVIKRRMEMASSEIAHANEADYVIINRDFSEALAQLHAIITAERCRFDRQQKRNPDVFAQLHLPQ